MVSVIQLIFFVYGRQRMDDKPLDVKTGEEAESQCKLDEDVRLEEYCTSEKNAIKLTDVHGMQEEKALASDLPLQGVHPTDVRIPRYMQFASLSENYLQYCLDLLEFRVANSLKIVCSPTVPCKISVNLLSPKKNGMSDNKLEPCQHLRRNTSDLGSFVIQCPSLTRKGQWTLSTVDRNQTVRKILDDPLLHLGALGGIINISRVGLIDIKGSEGSHIMNFPSRLSVVSEKKLKIEAENVKGTKHGSKSLHKRIFSFSNAKSIGSGKSSSSSSVTSFQGMLHCKWENGVPYFRYSVLGQREVYVAKMLKVESSDFKNLDCIYSFYTKKGGSKAQGSCHDSLDDLVAKMNVSSSLTFCSDSINSKVMEMEFVLFGADAYQIGIAAGSDLTLVKQIYPNKVVDTFRPKHLHRHKSCLKFGAQKSAPKSCSMEPHQDDKLEGRGRGNVGLSPTNFELAAIIVKEQVHDNHQNAVGGWGLKFLEKVQVEHASTSQEAYKSNCSTTVDVILPEGVHGAPSTQNGGPSGLIERWRSGGQCDCGGWDIGCPLTVLCTQSSKEVLTKGEGTSLNLVKKGTKQSIPSLKMGKISDDKYHIHFHSPLSSLQSFSTGVALLHPQFHSPITRDVQKLKQ